MMIELNFHEIANRIIDLRTWGKPLTREASGKLDDRTRMLALEILEALKEQANRRKGNSL